MMFCTVVLFCLHASAGIVRDRYLYFGFSPAQYRSSKEAAGVGMGAGVGAASVGCVTSANDLAGDGAVSGVVVSAMVAA